MFFVFVMIKCLLSPVLRGVLLHEAGRFWGSAFLVGPWVADWP